MMTRDWIRQSTLMSRIGLPREEAPGKLENNALLRNFLDHGKWPEDSF